MAVESTTTTTAPAPTTTTTATTKTPSVWTADLEVNLFHALTGHKITGVNRFFHMACVYHKLMAVNDNKEALLPDNLWTHLTSM